MQKKKILYWTGHYFGGAEKSLAALIQNLPEHIDPHFIFFRNGEVKDYYSSKGYKCFVLPLTANVYSLNRADLYNPLKYFKILFLIFQIIKAAFALKKIIIENAIEILHLNNLKPMIISAVCSMFVSVKLVFHYRTHLSFKPLNYFLYFFADQIICISEFVKTVNFGKKKNKKIKVIYNGIDFDNLKLTKSKYAVLKSLDINEYADNTFFIGISGYFYRWKKFEIFIKAIAEILKENKDCYGIIIGDYNIGDTGYFDELKKLVKSLDIENKIIFAGYRTDVFDVLNALDVFVSASDNEPLGRAALEALAFAKPVIAPDCGGLPEFVKDNENGLIYKFNEYKQLSEKILILINNPDLINKFGLKGAEEVRNDFNISKHTSEISKVYNEIL